MKVPVETLLKALRARENRYESVMKSLEDPEVQGGFDLTAAEAEEVEIHIDPAIEPEDAATTSTWDATLALKSRSRAAVSRRKSRR